MNYNTQELDKLVNDWILFQYKMNNAKTKDEEDKIECYNMELMDSFIIHKLPKLALSIILKILEKDPSPIVMRVLAAGELEDLLSEHGELMINEIEAEARKNSQFKKMLGGVWQADMSDKIYQRVICATGGEEKKW